MKKSGKAGCPNLPILKICHPDFTLTKHAWSTGLLHCSQWLGLILQSHQAVAAWKNYYHCTIISNQSLLLQHGDINLSSEHIKFKLPNHVYDVYATFFLARTKISAPHSVGGDVGQGTWPWVNWVNRFGPSQQQDDLKSPINEISGDWDSDLHLHGAVAWSQPPQGGRHLRWNPTKMDKPSIWVQRSESRAKEPHDRKAFRRKSEVFDWNGKNSEIDRPIYFWKNIIYGYILTIMPHNVCICVICAINTYIWACGPFCTRCMERSDIEWSGLALFSAERCSTYRTSWQHCRLKLKNCDHRYSMATPANKAGSRSNKMMMTCKQAAPPFATCAQDSFCIHFWSILAAVPGVTSDHNFCQVGTSRHRTFLKEKLDLLNSWGEHELGFYMQNTPFI